MGPPHLCGGMIPIASARAYGKPLQWGRRISAAEW